MTEGAHGEVAVSEGTVTDAVVKAAAENGAAVLVDAGDGSGLLHTEFAALVPAAASGLVSRGVRCGDVAVIQVTGARDFALALHAVTASGAIPVPVAPDVPTAELATLLIRSAARILVTGEPHTVTAVEAADRSYVRQVFAFGMSSVGATPFDELLAGPGGSTPSLDPARDVALRTYDPFTEMTHVARLSHILRLAAVIQPERDDVLVACPALCRAPIWAGLVDMALLRGTTFVAVGDPGPEELLRAVADHGATIAVLDPATSRQAVALRPTLRAFPAMTL